MFDLLIDIIVDVSDKNFKFKLSFLWQDNIYYGTFDIKLFPILS